MKQYRLFIGNPGVGKSTLVNCIAQKNIFKNGIAIGGGMTYQLDMGYHNGITYMDTPGLADIKLRKKAAEAITEALKQDGMYQIFFVVTLEAGRVRPQDLATIKIVLESAKDITSYSLIINKLTKKLYKGLQENNHAKLKQLIAELNFGTKKDINPPEVLLLLRYEELDDEDDAYTSIEELNDFVENASKVIVHPANVTDVPGDDKFEKAVAKLEKQLVLLRSDNASMRRQLKETEKKYLELVEKKDSLKNRILDSIPIFGPIIKESKVFDDDAILHSIPIFGPIKMVLDKLDK